MQHQISPAVVVVVIVVVILVLVAMWHFIYGQQEKLAPADTQVEPPDVGPGAVGEEVRESEADEEDDEEDKAKPEPRSVDD